MTTSPVYIDATMMYRWRDLAPVGIVRLERMLNAHIRFRSEFANAQYVLWDNGYRPATASEAGLLDRVLTEATDPPQQHSGTSLLPSDPIASRRVLPALRRAGLRTIAHVPGHLRPFAEQAMWSAATFGVETTRYVKLSRQRRATRRNGAQPSTDGTARHSVDFSAGGDLIALGLGWEYLDHVAMYRLRHDHGVRIHMPAFDLIPVTMPQMNAGQSHLVHRYYAEMAHYADTVTSISQATADALNDFYEREQLPVPHLVVNPLPGFESPGRSAVASNTRRHRFENDDFVLTVSTVEVRKNHLMLVKVWAECIRDGIEMPRLVIVGRIGWDVNELMQWVFHAPELEGKCVILSDVDDDELVELYSDAMFTVFPSRIEGWGLPITESLTYGKVCIHSTDPAQVEASQGLMPAIHPDDFVTWKAEIVRAVSEPDYRSELETLISERYQRRTPQEYCETFAAIVARRRGIG